MGDSRKTPRLACTIQLWREIDLNFQMRLFCRECSQTRAPRGACMSIEYKSRSKAGPTPRRCVIKRHLSAVLASPQMLRGRSLQHSAAAGFTSTSHFEPPATDPNPSLSQRPCLQGRQSPSRGLGADGSRFPKYRPSSHGCRSHRGRLPEARWQE